ncbi:Protein of unknown function [Propionibacterium freudenreichii subsp. freudenreichii]|nr:Protein of unknown function [Propionibacterium freudenreichii subsp. freudenreichii]
MKHDRQVDSGFK